MLENKDCEVISYFYKVALILVSLLNVMSGEKCIDRAETRLQNQHGTNNL